ncbi:short-chain dehydrogenase [Polychaeton citri CBS 116435]|uniref:Short-chain dehydrogenase n=1 Tax=Polychaeton citri CBS 116435 TaxID=1314669 RepID=A0A9P4Q565_9PEZI|nr:short-chain dehydrogenase [Polychaeton citri CBS 116435]
MASQDVFQIGWQPPVTHQPPPGREEDLPVEAAIDQVPTVDGGSQLYKASGKLEGRKALITGGDSGIGRAIAVLYAMEGADVAIAYLQEEEEDAQKTKKWVEKYGKKCHLIQTNLRKKEECKKTADEALKALGTINILVNNHGTQMMRDSILDIPEEQWELTFATNIHSLFYLSKYVLPHMKKGDTIINNASVNAYIGRPDLLDYTSTKGAVVSFTRGLSNQWVGKGIRVNAVAPGPVWTPLIPSTMNDEAQKSFNSPMGRPGQPSEIATCFVFLASTDSSQLSGQVLHANGGVVVNG